MSRFSSNELFMEPKTKQYGSHMVMTNVQKSSKTKLISLDTKYRDDYNYQETIDYNMTLPERVSDVRSMKVESVEIPGVVYNISSGLGNNCFQLTNHSVALDTTTNKTVILATKEDVASENAASTDISWIPLSQTTDSRYQKYVDLIIVPDGYYTVNELVSQLNTLLQSSSLDRVTAQSNLKKPDTTDLVIANTLSGSVNIVNFYSNASIMTIDFTVDDKGYTKRDQFTSSLGWTLGYREQTIDLTYDLTESGYVLRQNTTGYGPAGQPVVYGTTCVNVNTPSYLYLAIDEFQSGNQNNFLTPLYKSVVNKHIIARVAVDTSTYSVGKILVATKSNGLLASSLRDYTSKIDLQKMNVKLLYSNGNLVNTDGVDISLLLEIQHE